MLPHAKKHGARPAARAAAAKTRLISKMCLEKTSPGPGTNTREKKRPPPVRGPPKTHRRTNTKGGFASEREWETYGRLARTRAARRVSVAASKRGLSFKSRPLSRTQTFFSRVAFLTRRGICVCVGEPARALADVANSCVVRACSNGGGS